MTFSWWDSRPPRIHLRRLVVLQLREVYILSLKGTICDTEEYQEATQLLRCAVIRCSFQVALQ